MNSTRGSTPPNPSLDLPNRSTGLNKTLGTIGTPHEESIAKFNPTKTCPNKRNRRNPAKTFSNPRTLKTSKSSPLTHGFGKGITAQKTMKGSYKFPPTNPQEQGPENTRRVSQRGGSKNHHQEQLIQTLRNHTESSIRVTKVHTRSSLLPDHPTLSTRPHHEALKLVLWKSKENRNGK
jgi:hypothetical protein